MARAVGSLSPVVTGPASPRVGLRLLPVRGRAVPHRLRRLLIPPSPPPWYRDAYREKYRPPIQA
eukprot:scaffold19489_cov110-Isochrysis_galbana.AAC.1